MYVDRRRVGMKAQNENSKTACNEIVELGSKWEYYWFVDIAASVETKGNTQMPQPSAQCTPRSKEIPDC